MKTTASQPATVERELTDAEWAVITNYTERFGYPQRPDLS